MKAVPYMRSTRGILVVFRARAYAPGHRFVIHAGGPAFALRQRLPAGQHTFEILANRLSAAVAVLLCAGQQLRHDSVEAHRDSHCSERGGARRDRIRDSMRRVSFAWNGCMPLTIS